MSVQIPQLCFQQASGLTGGQIDYRSIKHLLENRFIQPALGAGFSEIHKCQNDSLYLGEIIRGASNATEALAIHCFARSELWQVDSAMIATIRVSKPKSSTTEAILDLKRLRLSITELIVNSHDEALVFGAIDSLLDTLASTSLELPHDFGRRIDFISRRLEKLLVVSSSGQNTRALGLH